ncbi:clathrin-adaptor medium chain apm 3 [Fragilariopsis cylindrus CCMP1102]|uniref:Clathrin-adaptor medium chain apm 3 n=1 Tax=Fragilariopsis cylindrus CCMP1102 TaxID=635003 RepID=A0A1E7FBM9_9STRA|nr:clathrin-adaptor medium chain apm 3 [Fragilariopsis cylindrus CCMP1102]|eukprot:OEU15559.1 clathrin-adaptor medium chain apm 3 [Fragilariopsis cylindrus CCMP1102]
MIQSMFILSPTGEVLIERHFRGTIISRSVCDYFWEKASKGISHHGAVLPVMEVPNGDHGTVYIISILRDGLSYLAVIPAEVSPLMIIEFLHRIADIFVDYFGSPADESAVKENFSIVYQLLEEMVDYGWPLTTEPNALKAMIRPPTVMSKISAAVFSNTNVSDALPTGMINNMPWRADGVVYTQNEIYMDIVEEIDAIIDAVTGNIVYSDVSGSVQCQCSLSGVPDLLLTFKDPGLIDDCSFHPCVRYGRFDRDKVVSFVPPDGKFELMKYSLSPDRKSNFSPPLECHSQWNVSKPEDFTKSLSSLITSASRNSNIRMMVEDVAITIPLPKQVWTATFQVSIGSVVYDEAGKVAKWTLGKLADYPNMPRAQLTATLKLTPPKKHNKHDDDEDEDEKIQPPNLSLHWKIPLTSVSGLTVSGLSITGESYQPYKGVRNITKSGLYQVRYS